MWRQAGAGGWPARVNGIGAREKYSAYPSRSTTTLVTFGFCSSAASSIRLRSVDITTIGSAQQRLDRVVDHRGLDQRLVSLHVDDDLAPERRGDFGEPVGAAR